MALRITGIGFAALLTAICSVLTRHCQLRILSALLVLEFTNKQALLLARLSRGDIMSANLRLVQPPGVIDENLNALPTFIQLFELYLDRKKSKLKPMTVKGYKQCVRTDLADWRDLRLDVITRKMVADKHAKISDKNSIYGKGEGQADHAFRLVRALFNFAKAIFRDEKDDPLIKSNPCEVLKEARQWNRQKARSNYLHEDQLPIFWKAATSTPYPVIRDWLRFILLTGFRKNEARLLRWQDVDFKQRTITLKNTKNGRDHVFPLTDHLFELLKKRLKHMPPEVSYVFNHPDGTNSPLPYNTRRQDQVSAATGFYWTLHDLRRTYAQSCYSCELSEVAIKTLLNHASYGVTEKHYLGATNLRAIRQPAQRVEDYILSHCTGAPLPKREEIADEIEEPKPKEKIRLRMTLEPVEDVLQPVAMPLETKPKYYRKLEPGELIKAVNENRAKIGGVEF